MERNRINETGIYRKWFLESGKTEFISYTLAQPYFQTKGKTLLIVCEEGEEEYDEALLAQSKTIMEVIDDEEAFTTTNLVELEKSINQSGLSLNIMGCGILKI